MTTTNPLQILTKQGEELLARLAAEEKELVIDKFIFADVPDRGEFPSREEAIPHDYIVHEEPIGEKGRLTENSVIYTATLASDVGPFYFNWSGLYCSEHNVLVTIHYPKRTPKTQDQPGIAGNTLVRSQVLQYTGVAEITNITVDASTWQYNSNDRLKKMDADVAQALIDQNGKDWFIGDGFQVLPKTDTSVAITPGAGYVSGNRVSLGFERIISVPTKPAYIYLDAKREGTPTGEQITTFNFVVSAEEKDDYIDTSTGKQIPHFVCKIAQVLEDGSVEDLRPNSENELDYTRFNIVEGSHSHAEHNSRQLKRAIEYCTRKGIWFVLSNEQDISIVEDVRIFSNTLIRNVNSGGFLRLNDEPNEFGQKAVMSTGSDNQWVTNFKIKGDLRLQFSALIDEGKANRRGKETVGFYAAHINGFELEIEPYRCEFALSGTSWWNGKGRVLPKWCHKGWYLNPFKEGALGVASTSLKFWTTFDQVIHPFVMDNVVYSDFSGYVQGIREHYDHFETDEVSVVYNINGCASTKFKMGIEAAQSMALYNNRAPNYVTFRNRHELGPDAEDHFVRNQNRVSNVPYEKQAYYSSTQPGTLTLDDCTLSGSTVVTSVDNTPLFHKGNRELLTVFNGGFIEQGEHYEPLSGFASNYTGEARFLSELLYSKGNESEFLLNTAIEHIILPNIAIQPDGTFTVRAPSGYRRIINVTPCINKNTSDMTSNYTLINKSDTEYTYSTQTGAGYTVSCQILAIRNK
ncbi:phage tail protein [Vibrio vulnificus]|nr:phage tail protein [Vibrio vulnificus]RZQ00202.1 hypothetical protein D8T54_03925 [Vibrio vulnificus]